MIPQSEDVLVVGITAGRTDPVSDSLDTRMDSELDAREYEDPTQILSLLAMWRSLIRERVAVCQATHVELCILRDLCKLQYVSLGLIAVEVRQLRWE